MAYTASAALRSKARAWSRARGRGFWAAGGGSRRAVGPRDGPRQAHLAGFRPARPRANAMRRNTEQQIGQLVAAATPASTSAMNHRGKRVSLWLRKMPLTAL